MKIVNDMKPKELQFFEFKKGKVYLNKENDLPYLCAAADTRLILYNLDTGRAYSYCTPTGDPAKWEEVEATLTITNK